MTWKLPISKWHWRQKYLSKKILKMSLLKHFFLTRYFSKIMNIFVIYAWILKLSQTDYLSSLFYKNILLTINKNHKIVLFWKKTHNFDVDYSYIWVPNLTNMRDGEKHQQTSFYEFLSGIIFCSCDFCRILCRFCKKHGFSFFREKNSSSNI